MTNRYPTPTPELGYRAGAGRHFAGDEWQLQTEVATVPLKRGRNGYTVRVATLPDLTLTSLHIENKTASTTGQHTDYKVFVLPISAASEYCANGESLDHRDIGWNDPDGFLRVMGEDRVSVAGAVKVSRLIRDIAALEGVDPEDACVDFGTIRQTAREAAGLRAQIQNIIRTVSTQPQRGRDSALAAAMILKLADCIVAGGFRARRRGRTNQRWAEIVRKAEQRFQMAGSEPVSLADLCLEAGVSKSALYTAFGNVCGEAPVAYFRKRRLFRVYHQLRHAPPARGAVKRAALDAGFTELGRFSVRYRELFGESPSETLKRAAGSRA